MSSDRSKTRAELFAFLDELGIAHATIEHPPLYTVEESRALRGEIAGAHAKNLFVKDKKSRLFMISVREELAVDLKQVHTVIGGQGRVSFGSAEQLEEVWGVKPGSVTPFGAINDLDHRVTVVLDAGLVAAGTVNFHPLENTATTTIEAGDLVRFLQATGHSPLITELPVQAPQPVETAAD
ncbi:prolyl-tRNA synthetase associated domain-containing protein [Methylobrevis albus]|uniref:Prolyl-tRNA synthetase associated domain-containing protein n=1 Tax=Methylobrevis albus TaxID=2793297 RepID=A0A931I1Q6_9HYPH|nr:YbaK/EbsC family protein [Methylobrevis albus]MBH0237814.1 prolyl-tRNA synthetase associated domain-containing protein [Methylobrevis albus]